MRQSCNDSPGYECASSLSTVADSSPFCRCPTCLVNLSLLQPVTLELNLSIFSFFTSNKCVRRLMAEWLAGCDPCWLSRRVPTASHLSCVISEHLGCTVTLLICQVGQSEEIVLSGSVNKRLLFSECKEYSLCLIVALVKKFSRDQKKTTTTIKTIWIWLHI